MSQSESLSFHVSGMHCASCASNIQRKLRKTPGVEEASVNYANEQATVRFDQSKVKKQALVQAVADVGYTAHLDSEADSDLAEQERAAELTDLKKKLVISGGLTAIYKAYRKVSRAFFEGKAIMIEISEKNSLPLNKKIICDVCGNQCLSKN